MGARTGVAWCGRARPSGPGPALGTGLRLCDAACVKGAGLGHREDWDYLCREQDAAVSCLRYGRDVLSAYRHPDEDADALFVLLATGAEKLLKLTYGATVQANTDR